MALGKKEFFSCTVSYNIVLFVILSIVPQQYEASLLLFHRPNQSHPIKNSRVHLLRTMDTRPMSVLPPNLPERFYTEFIMYYTPREDIPLPPWKTLTPPELPYAIGRGATWYAADLGIMIESYTDYCVPIFEPNSYFPCILFNYNGTAYFISDPTTGYGPCCIYRQPWSPPHRDFMQTFTHYFNKTTQGLGPGIFNQTIDWWVIPQQDTKKSLNRAVKDHPVFGGYGWARDRLESGNRAQVCFWYEGNVGWAQQLFYNFTDSGPRTKDLEGFELPKECHTSRACIYRP